MERNWDAVQEWLGQLLTNRGIDQISAEELTVPPGMDELFSLLQIKHHHEADDFDCVVVDCAPTGETLRLLSFPDVATWWLEKVFPWERRLISAARPLARGLLDIPLPDDAVMADRVLPSEAGEGYFAAWRELQEEQLELVRSAFEPVPILTAPWLERE